MQFLKTLFGTKKANPRAKKDPLRKELQLLKFNGPHPLCQELGKDMEYPQQKNLKLSAPSQPHPLPPPQPPLSTRLIQQNQHSPPPQPLRIHSANLVGIVNKYHSVQELLGDCLQINIGPNKEINCLSAMRRYCLDCLVVFWRDREDQWGMQEIVGASQKLVLVGEGWDSVKKMVKTYQRCLLQRLGDKVLAQCSDKLLFSLSRYRQFFILEFEDEKKFTKKFITRIKSIFSFLQDFEHIEQLAKMLTLQQYASCLAPGQHSKIEPTILLYKQAIEKHIQDQKHQEQLRRIHEMFAAELQEDDVDLPSPEPIRKNSSMEAQIEAEYFGKRESQKENRESQKQTRESGSKRLEQEELYYFIEEQEDCSSNEYSCANEQPAISSASRPSNTPPRIARSKSWNSLSEAKEQEIDEELFSKY